MDLKGKFGKTARKAAKLKNYQLNSEIAHRCDLLIYACSSPMDKSRVVHTSTQFICVHVAPLFIRGLGVKFLDLLSSLWNSCQKISDQA